MSNSYFQFKKFRVNHDQCAMKVGTDGVLLGVWTDVSNVKKILDIGTGSGLIAMILAQRTDETIFIDAIDVDQDAVNQSVKNVSCSDFDNINITQRSIQEYTHLSQVEYDLIVSNPPFFINSLHSPDKQRTTARHTDSLTMEELVICSKKLLADNGKLSVIYPFENKVELVTLAEKHNLCVSRTTNVYPTPTSKPKRVLLELSMNNVETKENDLIIELERHTYSKEFSDLAKDFYLKL